MNEFQQIPKHQMKSQTPIWLRTAVFYPIYPQPSANGVALIEADFSPST